MVGARRQHPAAAVIGHHAQLGEHVLAAVVGGQFAPELETPDRAQLGDVVQHAPADPGDLVQERGRRLEAQPLLHVPRVGGAVQVVTRPARVARGDPSGSTGPSHGSRAS